MSSGTKVGMPCMTPQRLTPRIQRQSSSGTSQIGPARADAGVVVDEVHGAELLQGPVTQVADRRGVGHVGHGGDDVGAGRGELVRGLLERVLLDVGEHDLHPLGRGPSRPRPCRCRWRRR